VYTVNKCFICLSPLFNSPMFAWCEFRHVIFIFHRDMYTVMRCLWLLRLFFFLNNKISPSVVDMWIIVTSFKFVIISFLGPFHSLMFFYLNLSSWTYKFCKFRRRCKLSNSWRIYELIYNINWKTIIYR
jgi:hypothetical protein